MKKLFTIVSFVALCNMLVNAQTGWTALISGTTNGLNSVYFTDSNTGYVVGESGKILKTTNAGSDWFTLSSGANCALLSVRFTDSNTGYAAGWYNSTNYQGTILKTTNAGLSWTIQTSGTFNNLSSIYFVDINTGYAVGQNGTIIKTTNAGVDWITQTSSTTEWLNSVYFIDANIGFAVGGFTSGVILKTTNGGTNWSISTATYRLFSVYFTDANNGYIACENGVILKTTDSGTNWTSHNTPYSLLSIYFTDTITGYAVGSYETIIKTSNAGNSWAAQNNGTTNWLQSMCFTDANTGYVVGDNGTIFKTTTGGELLPSSAGSISGSASICQGQDSVIYAVPIITNATSYIWSLPSGATGTSSTNSIIVNYGSSAVSGNITVKGHNSAGDGASSTLAITVNPLPATPIITQNDYTLISSANNGNQWYNATGAITDSTSQTYTATTDGDYYVIVTINGCCSDQSNIINVIGTGIGQTISVNNEFSIYPNPANDKIKIIGLDHGIIEIINVQGQIINTLYISNPKTIIDLSKLSSGVYTMKIKIDKKMFIRKLIKK